VLRNVWYLVLQNYVFTKWEINIFRFTNANRNSVEKELSNLNADGVIKRFRKGIYYKPQKSSLFKTVLPNPSAIAQVSQAKSPTSSLVANTAVWKVLGLAKK